MEITGWQGVFAPAKTPPEILATANAAFVKIQAMPDVRKEAEEAGFIAESSTPEDFTTLIRAEYERWGRLIEEGNIHLD